jgi:hypothetical protein
MYYRGPGFEFGSFPFLFPTPSPPHLPSVSSTCDKLGRVRKRGNLLDRKEEGREKEPNQTTARKPGPL